MDLYFCFEKQCPCTNIAMSIVSRYFCITMFGIIPCFPPTTIHFSGCGFLLSVLLVQSYLQEAPYTPNTPNQVRAASPFNSISTPPQVNPAGVLWDSATFKELSVSQQHCREALSSITKLLIANGRMIVAVLVGKGF